MQTLELRNLFAIYNKVNSDERYEVFYSHFTNNLIVFTPCDEDTDTESICNSIRPQIYNYLINELNSKNGLVISWSQVEGTTSDYTIYYDLDSKELKDKTYEQICDVLSGYTNDWNSMKYNAAKDGRIIPIKF